MIQNLNKQKIKLKEAIDKEINEYFTALENNSNKEDFDINTLERLMLENQKKIKAAMSEANSGVVSSLDTGLKKNVKNAETP